MTKVSKSLSKKSEAQKSALAYARSQKGQEKEARLEAGTASQEELMDKVAEQQRELQNADIELSKKDRALSKLKGQVEEQKEKSKELYNDLRVAKRSQQRLNLGRMMPWKE